MGIRPVTTVVIPNMGAGTTEISATRHLKIEKSPGTLIKLIWKETRDSRRYSIKTCLLSAPG